MPLGEKAGFEKSQSRYCGVETEFNDNVPQLLNFNLSTGAFDFIVAPLINPSYRPSLLEKDGVLPFAASDLVLSPSQWSSHVVGKISFWIDLDSEDETLRMASETTLKQEIAWANHLSIQACILPSPKGASCANCARCVNQILLGLNNMQLWLRIPLVKTDDDDVMDANSTSFIDSWELWNAFRLLCEHHSQLFVALDILSSLPSVNSLGRWFGEPVTAAIINMDVSIFWFPCDLLHAAPMMMWVLKGAIFNLPVFPNKWTGLSMPVKVPSEADYWVLLPFNTGLRRHPLRPYLDYVGFLFRSMDPIPEQYQRAISKALLDRVPDEEASAVTVVVGAGRRPLVRTSLQAAEETGHKLKVYAVEKNPNAVVTLHSLVKLEGWEDIVTIISCDMRYWDAPEKADILVSELLGSFGDNELSPECLDGAQSYTSFIQPVTAAKLYNDVKSHKDLVHFETAYVVKLPDVARLAPSQTITQPTKKSNQRYKRLQFEIPCDTGSAMVHGFAGHFDAKLYKDVHLGIEPSTATPNMFRWNNI
ncbi:hypothetical protein Peur_009549 [Populus x canadensis]